MPLKLIDPEPQPTLWQQYLEVAYQVAANESRLKAWVPVAAHDLIWLLESLLSTEIPIRVERDGRFEVVSITKLTDDELAEWAAKLDRETAQKWVVGLVRFAARWEK